MVADVLEDWVNNADVDGFNVACKIMFWNPNFADMLTQIQMSRIQNRTKISLSYLSQYSRSAV